MTKSVLTSARNTRGIALPFALVGLVAVSILVTTVLLTSSTEFAISAAHRDAATSLYAADAAMEQFVAGRIDADSIRLQAGLQQTIAGPDGRSYSVLVAKLAFMPRADMSSAEDIYSLLVQPTAGRGRTLGAFVTTARNFDPLSLAVNAGATSGGDIRVSGNAVISSSAGANYCEDENNQSEFAVQVSAGSKIDGGQKEDRRIDGETNVAEWTKEEMEDVLLGGQSLRSLADGATIKFGPLFRTDPWSTTRANSNTGTAERFDWGCPQELLERTTCPSLASQQRLVAVAIDAEGGTITINGDYGQGMLMVVNGSLRIQGNFVFKGVLLVENDLFILGGGGGEESKIEGAVVSFGASSTIEDNVSGTATVRYNRCAVRDAQRALNQSGLMSAPQRLQGLTYAWHEIIR
jgi:hypothetical protein